MKDLGLLVIENISVFWFSNKLLLLVWAFILNLNKTAYNLLRFVEHKLWGCIIVHLMYLVQFAQRLQLEFERVITYDYIT